MNYAATELQRIEDRLAIALSQRDRLAEALRRLLERFEREYVVPASGTLPHEIALARDALAAIRKTAD